MTILTEAPAFKGNLVAVLTEVPEACLLLNGKIMTILTEAYLILMACNGSSDRSTSKPTSYSMAKQ